MKLLINGEYKEVGFWSFLKCNILVSIASILLFWAVLFCIGFTIGFMSVFV